MDAHKLSSPEVLCVWVTESPRKQFKKAEAQIPLSFYPPLPTPGRFQLCKFRVDPGIYIFMNVSDDYNLQPGLGTLA